MKKIVLIISLTFLIPCLPFASYILYGQGNYDAILEVINEENYVEAEYLLKSYIKNYDRNPNAYLNLGLIFQQKIDATDEREEKVSCMDSALYFYNKTISLMSVSHLNKHKEYYKNYTRRDLRTGKKIIRYEDILFDLDYKKKELTSQLYNYCRTSEVDLVIPENKTDKLKQGSLIKPNGKYCKPSA